MNKIMKWWQELTTMGKAPEVRAFWAITAFQNMGTGWFHGTYVIFLVSHGASLFQVTLINSVFMAVDTILNPYTGKLADRIGQKKIFLLGQLFWFGGMLSYGFSHSFWWFTFSEAVSAIGAALMSDALESWIRNIATEERSHQVLAYSESFRNLGVIPAAILGSIIGAKFGLEWPWFMAAGSGIIVMALTLKMLWHLPESYGGQEEETQSVWEVFRNMTRSSELRYTAGIAFVMAMCVQPFNMFWQPILKEASGSEWWFGTLWIGISLMAAVGSQWARTQVNGKGVAKMLVITALPMLFTPWIKEAWLLTALFLFHEVGRGAFRPIMFTYANRHIANNCRSTANSIQSSIRTMGAATGLLVFGAMTQQLEALTIWGIASLVLLATATYAWKRN